MSDDYLFDSASGQSEGSHEDEPIDFATDSRDHEDVGSCGSDMAYMDIFEVDKGEQIDLEDADEGIVDLTDHEQNDDDIFNFQLEAADLASVSGGLDTFDFGSDLDLDTFDYDLDLNTLDGDLDPNTLDVDLDLNTLDGDLGLNTFGDDLDVNTLEGDSVLFPPDREVEDFGNPAIEEEDIKQDIEEDSEEDIENSKEDIKIEDVADGIAEGIEHHENAEYGDEEEDGNKDDNEEYGTALHIVDGEKLDKNLADAAYDEEGMFVAKSESGQLDNSSIESGDEANRTPSSHPPRRPSPSPRPQEEFAGTTEFPVDLPGPTCELASCLQNFNEGNAIYQACRNKVALKDLQLREHRAEIETLRTEIRDLRTETRRLQPKLPKLKIGNWRQLMRAYLRGENIPWNTVVVRSCLEGNMSTNPNIMHPAIRLVPLEFARSLDDLFDSSNGADDAALPRSVPDPNSSVNRFDSMPAEIQARIFKLWLFKGKGTLIHALSRLDPYSEPSPDQPVQYMHKFHYGHLHCSLTAAPDAAYELRTTLVSRRWYFIGSNVFFSTNHFCFSSLGEFGRFCNGIGSARVERLRHIHLVWTGSQYLTLPPKTPESCSKRTIPLRWFLSTHGLKTLSVYINETGVQYIRRRHEGDEVRMPLAERTEDQPNYRITRALRTVQGMDYVHQLRGLKWVKFYDLERALQHGDPRKEVIDTSFMKDLNRTVQGGSGEMDSTLRGLAPLRDPALWEPKELDWKIVESIEDQVQFSDPSTYDNGDRDEALEDDDGWDANVDSESDSDGMEIDDGSGSGDEDDETEGMFVTPDASVKRSTSPDSSVSLKRSTSPDVPMSLKRSTSPDVPMSLKRSASPDEMAPAPKRSRSI